MPLSIHGLSLRSVPLEIKCNGEKMANATGFFLCWEGRTFLVSNWHVFTGCHPITKLSEFMHSGVPEEIAYPRFVSTDYSQREWDTVKLTDNDGNNCWFQNPAWGSAVDVAVIEVPTKNDKGFLGHVDYSFRGGNYERTPRYEMATRLSIIGFPIPRRPTGCFPIWIQSTVASEMDLGYDGGKRAFLVDALTSKGMSGSPVFKQETEENYSFVGVYSGREKEGDVELPLGLVWNRETICETIIGGTRGAV